MDEETKKLIQEQYAKLPKQLQDAIQSSHVHEKITSIATAHKLHVDQIGVFENEIMLLMMGFTDPIEFVGELKKELGIDAEAAQELASDANQHILLPIRDSMEGTTHDPLPPEKSVLMPSATKTAGPSVTVPPAPLNIKAAARHAPPLIPAAAKVAAPTAIPKLDTMLSQPTVSVAPKPAMMPLPNTSAAPAVVAPADIEAKPTPPPPPQAHGIDPYREPPE